VIESSRFLGYASALSDGDASYLLWIIGLLNFMTWAMGLSVGLRESKWYRWLNIAALLALPCLLLVGMVVSMIPSA